MKITVRVFGEPAQIIGNRHTIELGEGATVVTLANRLTEEAGLKRHGYIGEYKVGGGDLAILVNGRNVELMDGLKTALVDGDEVVILVPTSGG